MTLSISVCLARSTSVCLARTPTHLAVAHATHVPEKQRRPVENVLVATKLASEEFLNGQRNYT